MCPEFNQIKGKVQGVKKILKSNFDVENVYGLGVKTAKKQGKMGEKVHEHLCVKNPTKNRDKYKATT